MPDDVVRNSAVEEEISIKIVNRGNTKNDPFAQTPFEATISWGNQTVRICNLSSRLSAIEETGRILIEMGKEVY
ncbi:hypothetical protein PXK30_09625 [Phaeobacter gallaeciensis]|uniref:hypothetical protein n=1 Tax=Phaeobacter gallaeciensis TaxID=60890 RepID=UPI00237F7105|nr:hypothetical protein [Phaeobacter gallaeciensis]MDE4303618.1 hypothetical protein [Phaeobacter gallaeciensis]MDE4307900.1 hypothetical protein [Phaeobacter gallaeciensis]MDE4312358.1 hypothetical protein [Phaeobacter gallaeciensis]MDE4316829.1 hypothetical protein [Phaeobacter gallaeciensis]MDE4321292.1 hypothetical protein [Phaeobacter gallaeciensis]